MNDDELGEIIDYALQWKCVRGITFQPIQDAGRNENFDPSTDRIVLSDIRRKIIEAKTPFGEGDIIPLPCNPESIAIGYALRSGNKIAPITSFFPKDMLVEALPNAITFEKYPDLHKQILNFFSLSTAECNNPEKLDALLCCLPQIPVPEGMGYENIFRIAIVEFMDAAQFLRRPRQAQLHPFRDAQRPDHSVRNLQHVLPRRSGAEAHGGEQGDGMTYSPKFVIPAKAGPSFPCNCSRDASLRWHDQDRDEEGEPKL